MQHHLTILLPDWIELILDGSKTIGCWFTQIRCAPYGKVNKGDIIYMRENKGRRLVHGIFTASEVETFDTITLVEKDDIYANYGQQIFGRRFVEKSDLVTEELKKWHISKYATLIHITKLYPFPNPKPLPFQKSDGRSWVVLDKCQVQELRKVEGCYREGDPTPPKSTTSP